MLDKLHPPADPRSVDELVNAALGENDEDLAWNAVCTLHWRGTGEVLRRATELCRSECSHERRLGTDILGQLGVPERTYPQRCVDVLLQMLRAECDPGVLHSILVALSFLHDPRAVPVAAAFAEHSDPNVRHAAVLALTGHEDAEAIAVLIRLTRDSDSDVRDWATFAIGTQIEIDIPEIRNALAERMQDMDVATRGEALIGLARRRDPRVVTALETELAADCVDYLAVEAAEIIEAPELHAPLCRMREWWDVDPDLLERAIAACAGR